MPGPESEIDLNYMTSETLRVKISLRHSPCIMRTVSLSATVYILMAPAVLKDIILYHVALLRGSRSQVHIHYVAVKAMIHAIGAIDADA